MTNLDYGKKAVTVRNKTIIGLKSDWVVLSVTLQG